MPGTPDMRLLSVNAGTPGEVEWEGRRVLTAIFKAPLGQRARVGRLGLDVDAQADHRYHGGVEKAVYVYPSEHYAFWREKLGETRLPWGSFGENLTTEGRLETAVQVGERWRIGTAQFVVKQPRTPCFKLNLKFQRRNMLKQFLASRRFGFYLSVEVEGEIGDGDAVEVIPATAGAETISEVVEAQLR